MTGKRMTYGEWVVYWKERLPLVDGQFRPPGRPPKRMKRRMAIAYYTLKLRHAWRAAGLGELS